MLFRYSRVSLVERGGAGNTEVGWHIVIESAQA